LICSLRIGDRVVSLCDDGLLVAEYALFEPHEAVLHATDPVSVREAGYMTTAARALERLAREGVTPELAEDAAKALGHDVIVAYGRGEAARALGGKQLLGPQELFDGAVFRAATRVYEGMWLDLRALSRTMGMPDAPLLLQALHLASALSEVAPGTPLHLSTAGATRDRRPAERTFQRPSFDAVGNVPDVLRGLGHLATPVTVDMAREAKLQPALLARVRERLAAETSVEARTRLSVIERTLAERTATAPSGPMGDSELRDIERRIDSGQSAGIEERLDRLEAKRGSVAGIRYLRARLALLKGERPPRYIAQELTELAEIDHGFHEAALGAARTWLAAGEEAHARYFAHQLADDPTAKDSERIVAMEILNTTEETNKSDIPPPIVALVEPMPPRIPPRPRVPNLGNVPPPGPLPPALSAPPPPVMYGVPQLPPRAEATPARTRPQRYDPELVESLTLPYGSAEEDLAPDQRPTTPAQARVAMTRLARDLARDYRLWYGRTLRCDISAIDSMQQHLLARFTGAPIEDPAVAWELRRHGALLSEIVARSLGGAWADVGPSEPGYWVMVVPPAVRTCPIGRVYRFVSLGRQERDLVSHFLALDSASRRG
jgi:hypothetical protein